MAWRRSHAFSFLSVIACLVLLSAFPVPAAAWAEGYFQRTLQVNGPVDLDITSGSGNIIVRVGSSSQVQVTGRIKATTWFGGDGAEDKVKRIEANPPIQQSGNIIRVGHIDDPELRRNISISYEVSVPPQTQLRSHTGSGNQTVEGVRNSVDAGSGSGSLRISDIGNSVRADAGSGSIEIERVQGNVRAKTGSGTIRASKIAGGFEADAGSGSIKLEQTAPGAVRVETGSGSLDLYGLQGSLEAKTGSGSIRAQGAPTGTWSLSTGSGGVHLETASNTSFDLQARTGSGSISTGPSLNFQGSTGRREVSGKVRGGGVPVRVQTGSGGIDVQ